MVCGALAEVVGTAPVLYAGTAYVVVATAVVLRVPSIRRLGAADAATSSEVALVAR